MRLIPNYSVHFVLPIEKDRESVLVSFVNYFGDAVAGIDRLRIGEEKSLDFSTIGSDCHLDRINTIQKLHFAINGIGMPVKMPE